MLKHDEMIENVHRRIAQYEEEKKMKKAKFKNIISLVKPNANSEFNKTNEDEYIEVVSGTDTIKRSSGILRIVSAAAACAILVGGIGTTGFLMHKQNKNKPTSETESVTETTAETTESKRSEIVCPFGDFRNLYFRLDIVDDGNFGNYSSEVYAKLADYLNAFNWGEKTTGKADTHSEEAPYCLSWFDNNTSYVLRIYDNGEAFYTIYSSDDSGNESVDHEGVYNIDFDSFHNGIQEIMKLYVYEKSISQEEIDSLVNVVLESAKINGPDGNEIVPADEENKAKLTEFLKGDFMKMIQPSRPGWDSESDSLYAVEQIFLINENTKRRQTYFICSNGHIGRCEYVTDENGEWQPSGTENYYVNVDELNAKLEEFIKNSHREKITENAEDTSNDTPLEVGQEMTGKVDPPKYPEPESIKIETDDEELYLTEINSIFHSTQTGIYVFDANNKLIASSKTHDHKTLESFVTENLDLSIISKNATDIYSGNDYTAYTILWMYKDKDGQLKYTDYMINDNGNVWTYFYEYKNWNDGIMEWVPADLDGGTVNFEEFKKLLNIYIDKAKL